MILDLAIAADSNVSDALTTLDRWSLLVGALLPLIVATVNRVRWPGWAKLLCAVLVCLIAAGVTVYVMGAWNPHDFVGSVIMVLFAAFFTYIAAWKPSGVTRGVEQATG